MNASSLPPISRKLFKVSACVDWLDLEISTTKPTQFRHIKEVLDQAAGVSLHVEPMNAGAGGVAVSFKVRVHDRLANSHADLLAVLKRVGMTYPMDRAPNVLAIEIACDFWHKGNPSKREDETLAMTHRLQKSLHADATKPRQFIPDPTGKTKGENRFLNTPGQRIDPRFNYRIGNKHDDLSWQVYFKCVNNLRPIEKNQWRARVEVTLRGAVLQDFAITDLESLATFSFDRMAQLFRFRRPTDPTKQARGNLFIRKRPAKTSCLMVAGIGA